MTFLLTVAPVLQAQITEHALAAALLLGQAPFSAVWRDQNRPYIHPYVLAEILLQVTNIREVSTEANYDMSGVEARRFLSGHRVMTLQVQARSIRQDIPNTSLEILERLSNRLYRQSVVDALYAVNCAIVDSNEITHIPAIKIDDRLMSVATRDFFVSLAFEETEEESEIVGWFDHIELTSHLANPLGVEYPNTVNVSEEVIPP